MRAIVTNEQRRSRSEAGLPTIEYASPRRGVYWRKGRGLLRGERRLSSVTYSRYAPSSFLVATQNPPAHCQGICKTLH